MEDIFSAALTLLFIMDPLGNAPIFINVLKNVPFPRRRIILIRELFIALLVMMVFLFSGQAILRLLGLSDWSVKVAGGLILFLIAIRMIFPTQDTFQANATKNSLSDEPFIVPLAIPLVAGPSLMASIVLLDSQISNILQAVAAIVLAWFVNSVFILIFNAMSEKLGPRVLMAMERLMGMLLVMMSVQILLEGVKLYIKTFN